MPVLGFNGRVVIVRGAARKRSRCWKVRCWIVRAYGRFVDSFNWNRRHGVSGERFKKMNFSLGWRFVTTWFDQGWCPLIYIFIFTIINALLLPAYPHPKHCWVLIDKKQSIDTFIRKMKALSFAMVQSTIIVLASSWQLGACTCDNTTTILSMMASGAPC